MTPRVQSWTFEKFLLFQVPMNIKKDWKAKLKSAYSFYYVKIFYNNCVHFYNSMPSIDIVFVISTCFQKGENISHYDLTIFFFVRCFQPDKVNTDDFFLASNKKYNTGTPE